MNLSRRGFLGAAATSSIPFFIGGCMSGYKSPRKISANSKVNVGIIGCGLIARFTNVPGFLKDDRCRVTVACDMVKMAPNYYYGAKQSGFGAEGFEDAKNGKFRRDVCGSSVIKALVDEKYGDKSCREVFDWREVIADPTIDAVCICTPDHWHAIIAIAAMKAGKHVFCQKPMSLGISEGKEMVRVAKETGVTFQVGNQGRSNPDYIDTEEMVLNGYAGKILGATVIIPGGDHWVGHGRSTEAAPLPKYFSKEAWELWQGPAAFWEGQKYMPSIHEPTCWRFNKRYGGGMIPDFGAHEFDILQRGFGTDLTGPVAVENMKTDLAKDNGVFSWAGEFEFEFVYADGRRVKVQTVNKEKNRVRQTVFHCEKGDVGVRAFKKTIPAELEKFNARKDLKDSDKHLYRPKNEHWHEADFIDGILESRQCNSTCEVGHRTISMAHIANICEQMRVSKLNWDPVAEKFIGANSEEANRRCYVPHYNGWTI